MLPIIIILFIFGAAFGSFACCQAWRIKNRDKSPRSHCQNCDYQLKTRDNIPIISWLILRGKCRKCGKPIGTAEILTELGLGLAFILTYLFYPALANIPSDLNLIFYGFNWLPLAELTVFLILLVPLAILFIYDLRWGELPVAPLTFSIICAIIWVILRQWSLFTVGDFSPNFITELLGAALVLPFLYYFLYKFSNEQWVGSGDWILCIPLALVLGNLWLAFLCLFTSNLLGTIFALPQLTRKNKHRQRKIHFGPFLILGFLAVFFAQNLLSGLLFPW